MKLLTKAGIASALLATTLLGSSAFAQDVFLMDGVEARPDGNSVVEAGKYQKDGPWVVAMSHFGVNANTWTVQTAHEAQGIADTDERIEKFIMLDANFDQAKQVSDIEDLLAQDPGRKTIEAGKLARATGQNDLLAGQLVEPGGIQAHPHFFEDFLHPGPDDPDQL